MKHYEEILINFIQLFISQSWQRDIKMTLKCQEYPKSSQKIQNYTKG